MALKNIEVRTNDDGCFECDVYLGAGNWQCRRTVEVTDSSADIADLFRRILRGETGVTEPDQPAGQICITENKRQYVVASWHTVKSLGSVDASVSFYAENGDEVTVPGVEALDGVSIVFVDDDGDDKGSSQVPKHLPPKGRAPGDGATGPATVTLRLPNPVASPSAS